MCWVLNLAELSFKNPFKTIIFLVALAILGLGPIWPNKVHVMNNLHEPIKDAQLPGFLWTTNHTDASGDTLAYIPLYQKIININRPVDTRIFVNADGYKPKTYIANLGGSSVTMDSIKKPKLRDRMLFVSPSATSVQIKTVMKDGNNANANFYFDGIQLKHEGRKLHLQNGNDPTTFVLPLRHKDIDIKEQFIQLSYADAVWEENVILIKRFYLNDRDDSRSTITSRGGKCSYGTYGCELSVAKDGYSDLELPFTVSYSKPVAIKFRAKLHHPSATLSIAFGSSSRILIGEGTSTVKIERASDESSMLQKPSTYNLSTSVWTTIATSTLSEIIQTNVWLNILILYRPSSNGALKSFIDVSIQANENSKQNVSFQPITFVFPNGLGPLNYEEKLRVGVVCTTKNTLSATVSDMQVTKMDISPFN